MHRSHQNAMYLIEPEGCNLPSHPRSNPHLERDLVPLEGPYIERFSQAAVHLAAYLNKLGPQLEV